MHSYHINTTLAATKSALLLVRCQNTIDGSCKEPSELHSSFPCSRLIFHLGHRRRCPLVWPSTFADALGVWLNPSGRNLKARVQKTWKKASCTHQSQRCSLTLSSFLSSLRLRQWSLNQFNQSFNKSAPFLVATCPRTWSWPLTWPGLPSKHQDNEGTCVSAECRWPGMQPPYRNSTRVLTWFSPTIWLVQLDKGHVKRTGAFFFLPFLFVVVIISVFLVYTKKC